MYNYRGFDIYISRQESFLDYKHVTYVYRAMTCELICYANTISGSLDMIESMIDYELSRRVEE